MFQILSPNQRCLYIEMKCIGEPCIHREDTQAAWNCRIGCNQGTRFPSQRPVEAYKQLFSRSLQQLILWYAFIHSSHHLLQIRSSNLTTMSNKFVA
jgi:hypothetical protein